MSKRKIWATKFDIPGAPYRRHESRVMAYRYVDADRANWAAGVLRSSHLTVYVDERDGLGWQTYERIDLSEIEVSP
jgi:hypothetical protein